jgi:hypothetical protein
MVQHATSFVAEFGTADCFKKSINGNGFFMKADQLAEVWRRLENGQKVTVRCYYSGKCELE